MDGLDLSGAPPEPIRPTTTAELVKRVVQVVVGLALAIFLLGWVLPWLTHTTWPEIIDNLERVGWRKALICLVLMFGGLWVYTFTISASLPGMRHAPALIVNLCGSGVSNSMPGGGAVGVAAQYAIFRSWGFSHRNIGTSLIITSTFNLLIRMVLPIVAIVWLILSTERDLPSIIVQGALIGGGAGLVLAGMLVAILASERSAHAIGRFLNAIVHPVLKLLRRDHGQDVEALAVDMRTRIIGVVRPNWPMLVLGIVGFLGIYFFLFRETMTAFGIYLTWGEAFACYAFSRLLTMVPLTPGGIGITEIAAVLMVAFGADGAAAAAAVFLFAIYSHLLEIPFGAMSAAVWAATRKRYRVDQPDGGPEDGPVTRAAH
ncbi:MAG: flippase-like domain-containing protein [Austwickia sp.]|nr:flippase-like domain-containing protein [Austwickia sp.]